MRGVNNPLDKIEAKILSRKKQIDNKLDDGTSLFDSPHKNFQRVFNSMNHANTNIQSSTLEQERKKMGDNLKEMGQMRHSDSKDSVRKNDIKMGSKNNIQIEEQVEENNSILNKLKEKESPFEITQQVIAQNLGGEQLSFDQQKLLQEEVMNEVNQKLQKENQISFQNPNQIVDQNQDFQAPIKQNNQIKQLQKKQYNYSKAVKAQNVQKMPLKFDKNPLQNNANKESKVSDDFQQQELKDKILAQDIISKLKKDQESLFKIKKQQFIQQQTDDMEIQNQNDIVKNNQNKEQIIQENTPLISNQKQSKLNINENLIKKQQQPLEILQTSQKNSLKDELKEQNITAFLNQKQDVKQIKADPTLYFEKSNSSSSNQLEINKNLNQQKTKIQNQLLNKNDQNTNMIQTQSECLDCKIKQKNISSLNIKNSIKKQKGIEFKIPLAITDDPNQLFQQSGQQIVSDQNSLTFEIIPKDSFGAVGKEIQVLNSERIIGYNTYSNILDRGVDDDQNLQQTSLRSLSGGGMVDDGDYYNVTLNLIVKKVNFLEQPVKQPKKVEQEQPLKEQTNDFNQFSQSNYAAAATLDISNTEAKKEIAESEHYQSKIAKQQVQMMDQQYKNEINSLNQQKIYQAQQIEDQQLLQVQVPKYDGLNKRIKRADQFDDEDGSSTKDDYFYRQQQIKKYLEKSYSKEFKQQLKKLDSMSIDELKQRKQKILQERKARRDHLIFMQKLRKKGMAAGSPTEDQELKELEEQERLQKIEVEQIIQPSSIQEENNFNNKDVQNQNENQQQSIKYNQKKIIEDEHENDPNCEESKYEAEGHEIQNKEEIQPQKVIEIIKPKPTFVKKKIEVEQVKKSKKLGGKIRIKEPDSYNQEVVNKEDRDQEQITNKFMNEMHKNYDYLSKNNQQQELIPLSQNLTLQQPNQQLIQPNQQLTIQNQSKTQDIQTKIQQNNTSIVQKQESQDNKLQEEINKAENQESPTQEENPIQEESPQQEQSEQIIENKDEVQKKEEEIEAPIPKILQSGLVEEQKQNQIKQDTDEVQEVPAGFSEEEESENAEDESLTQFKTNRLHSQDKIIIRKLNNKFKHISQQLQPIPILQNNENLNQNLTSTSNLEQEQKQLEKRIKEELRLLKQIADKKKAKQLNLMKKKIEMEKQINNIKEKIQNEIIEKDQQSQETETQDTQQAEQNKILNQNQNQNEEDSAVDEKQSNGDTKKVKQNKDLKSKIDQLNEEFDKQQVQKQKMRQEQLEELRILHNQQQQKLLKQQEKSVSAQIDQDEQIQNNQYSESKIAIKENSVPLNTKKAPIQQNIKQIVNKQAENQEVEQSQKPVEKPAEINIKTVKVKLLKKPEIVQQQLKDEVDEDEEKRQQELIQRQKREKEMRDTQKELDQIQIDLLEAQKQAEQYEKERIQQMNQNQEYYFKNQKNKVFSGSQNLKEEESQSLKDEKMDLGITTEMENQAFEEVEKARKIGEQKGAEAAAKMILQQKNQSHQENIKQFIELKKKLQTTSLQVEQIVDNFQQLHSDLKELKNEYIKKKQKKMKVSNFNRNPQPTLSVKQ